MPYDGALFHCGVFGRNFRSICPNWRMYGLQNTGNALISTSVIINPPVSSHDKKKNDSCSDNIHSQEKAKGSTLVPGQTQPLDFPQHPSRITILLLRQDSTELVTPNDEELYFSSPLRLKIRSFALTIDKLKLHSCE